MRIYKYILVIIAILAITTSTACIFGPANEELKTTKTPEPTATAIKEVTAQDIIDMSREKVKDVKSVHFRLEIANGSMTLGPGISINTIEGDGVEPGRLRIKTSVTVLNMPVEVELISVDGKQFLRDAFTRRWQVLSTPLAQTNFFDPDIGVANIMKNLQNPAKLPNEVIDGVDAYHLQGTLNPDVLSPIFGGIPADGTVKTELWIGTEDFLVRQIRLEGPILQEDGPSIARTLKLSRFNEPVTIEAPIAAP